MASTRTLAILGAILLGAFCGTAANGQSIEPRAYSAAPYGTNFVILGLTEARGAIPVDPALPLSDIDLKVHSALGAYARSLNLFGKSAKFDVVVPYGKIAGSAVYLGEPVERNVVGFSDPLARLTILFHGAPAMNAAKFRNYRQGLLLGASVQVSVPIGQYDEERLLNLGSNRWSVKPEIGVSKVFGRWTIELATGATFYSDNKRFLETHKRSQKPIYSAQSHLIYNIAPNSWVAVNLSWFGGGRTSIDGIEDDNLQRNWRTGITAAVPLDRRFSLKANASTGVSARTGNNFDLYGLAVQYRWGAGI